MKNLKKVFVTLITFLMITSICLVPVSASSDAYYYKGHDITYSEKPYVGDYGWETGWLLWKEPHKEKYYLCDSYYRCLTYFHDSWIANQGQMLSITEGKTVSRTVVDIVQAEIGVSDVVNAGLQSGYSYSATTEYSASLGITYDLSKCSRSSVRIASMGYIDRFVAMHYVNDAYTEWYYRYAHDTSFGQEIALVYRW